MTLHLQVACQSWYHSWIVMEAVGRVRLQTGASRIVTGRVVFVVLSPLEFKISSLRRFDNEEKSLDSKCSSLGSHLCACEGLPDARFAWHSGSCGASIIWPCTAMCVASMLVRHSLSRYRTVSKGSISVLPSHNHGRASSFRRRLPESSSDESVL